MVVHLYISKKRRVLGSMGAVSLCLDTKKSAASLRASSHFHLYPLEILLVQRPPRVLPLCYGGDTVWVWRDSFRGAGAVLQAPSYYFLRSASFIPDHTPRVGVCLPGTSADGASFPAVPLDA